MQKVRVWDLPIRFFHWLLLLLIVAAIITEKIGGNVIVWHFRCGYAALTLILFRILWGLVGGKYARFSSLIHHPSTIIAYAKGLRSDLREKYLGHNPLGGLSALALLAAVLMQAVSGLFANDDIANEGPFSTLVGKALSDKITWFHTEVSIDVVYFLIGLHIAAIAYYYFVKKENLVTPMITGDKEASIDAHATDDSWRMRLLALAIFAICAAGVYCLVNL